MKNTITFNVLLEMNELEFLAKNNFTKLPFHEIYFSFNKKSVEKHAEISINSAEDILTTASVECDIDRFSEYKYSHREENLTELRVLSKTEINTLNDALIDKIKIENVFWKDLQKINLERIKKIFNDEEFFFKRRMEIFLETNSREIILHNYFERSVVEKTEPQNFTDVEVKQHVNELVSEQGDILKMAKERTAMINSVEEAVDFLINEDFDEEKIKSLKNKSLAARLEFFGDLGFHFGDGIYLRNLFFHGNKNQRFFDDIEKYKSNTFLDGGELGEGVIYDLLWRKLNNCEISNENARKIKEIQKQIENGLSDDSYWNLHITMKLLSYNFTEDEIKTHLEFEKKNG
jgi:hypothetical protein